MGLHRKRTGMMCIRVCVCVHGPEADLFGFCLVLFFLSFYIQVYSSFNFQNTTIVEYQNKTIASDEIIITVLHAITTGNKMPEVSVIHWPF